MGEYDFTYRLPDNFCNRVVQFLQQLGKMNVAEAFQRCEYEYDDVGLAYYAGLRGDNWNKKAVDFTIEGLKDDITLLQSSKSTIKNAIEKALKPSESGYLIRNIYFFESDISLEKTKIPSSNEERLNVDIAAANGVLDDLIQIGERVCLNCSFTASSSENSINDYFRDMLFAKGYKEVKDQTRHGISVNGKDAAEVDILLTKDGSEIAIFEGLKLDSVKTAYIDEHIEKAIINYNALGTATFIVAYVNSADFESFWKRYSTHIQQYEFPLQIRKGFNTLTYPNAATRVATLILTRDGFDFPVYFIAFKIS
jgi:hypothetical protein